MADNKKRAEAMIPPWDQAEAAAKAGGATALQSFVYENTPAGDEAEKQFRSDLAAVLAEVLDNA